MPVLTQDTLVGCHRLSMGDWPYKIQILFLPAAEIEPKLCGVLLADYTSTTPISRKAIINLNR